MSSLANKGSVFDCVQTMGICSYTWFGLTISQLLDCILNIKFMLICVISFCKGTN